MKETKRKDVAGALGLGKASQLSIEAFSALNDTGERSPNETFGYIIGRCIESDDFEAIAQVIVAVTITDPGSKFFDYLQKEFLNYLRIPEEERFKGSKFPLGVILGTFMATNWIDANCDLSTDPGNDSFYVDKIVFLVNNILVLKDTSASITGLINSMFKTRLSEEIKKFVRFENESLPEGSRTTTVKKLAFKIHEETNGKFLSEIGKLILKNFTFAVLNPMEAEEQLQAIYAFFYLDKLHEDSKGEIAVLKKIIDDLGLSIIHAFGIVESNIELNTSGVSQLNKILSNIVYRYPNIFKKEE